MSKSHRSIASGGVFAENGTMVHFTSGLTDKNTMKVKVCGMRHPHNIEEVATLGIAMMGFIFYDKSPRFVGTEPVGIEATRSHAIQRVGVFVNERPEQILRHAITHQLDVVQLHGRETVGECRELRKEGLQVIKAISIDNGDDLAQADVYAPYVDLLLFDTFTPRYGGSGVRFDWSLLHSYVASTPFLLSGGISPFSLADLAQFHHPQWAGIDLNSGFESALAIKDAEALRKFIILINNPKTTLL